MEEQLALRMSRQDVLRNGDAPAHLRIVLDEAVLRRPIEDREAWHLQLERLVDEAQLSNVTLQMLPFSAGLHDLLGGSLTILWLPDGSAAAYQESAKSGEVIEEPEDVVRLKLSYDRTRDLALSPQDSVEFIRSLLKDG